MGRYDIARVPMTVETNASNVEQFTIRIEPDSAPAARGAAGHLIMEWGKFKWSVPITTQ
jgi:hypothetical protein